MGRILSLLALVTAALVARCASGEDAETALVTSHSVTGRLTYPTNFPVPTTKLSLNGGEHEAITRVDGSFTFHDVPPGIYLMDVLSSEAMFSQVKLNLPEEADGKIRALEYKVHITLVYFTVLPRRCLPLMSCANLLMTAHSSFLSIFLRPSTPAPRSCPQPTRSSSARSRR